MGHLATTVSGTFTATGQSATFRPQAGRYPFGGFNVTLSGTFVATVRLERTFDGGSTWTPLTVNGAASATYTAVCSEQFSEPEDGVYYRLNCTAYTSGTVTYRISQ